MRRLSLLFTAVMTALALVVLTSCGSDDESATSGTSSVDTAAVKDGGTSDAAQDASDDTSPSGDEVPSSDSDGPLVERIVASMMNESDTPFTEDQARCYAEANVRIIGADRIEQSLARAAELPADDEGLLDLNSFDYSEIALTKPEANEVYTAANDCGLNFRALLLESMSESGMPESARACVEDAVTEEMVRDLMVAVMTDGPATFMSGAGAEFSQALMTCDPDGDG